MLTDEVFVEMYAKAIGKVAAKEMLTQIRKSMSTKEKPSKVYLNEFGAEVHVNGDVAASLNKGETLQEKIARLDRLSAQVSAIRAARAMGLIKDDEFDIEEDPQDFDALDNVEIRDDFGDIVENHSVAESARAGKDTAAGSDAADGVAVVAGDELANSDAPGASAMASEQNASVSEID